MGENGRIVAIIPARGGSKRLPGKHLLPLGGKPLIKWTIEAAMKSGCFADVVVSSDDGDILAIAEGTGAVSHRRPDRLATDAASTVDVLLDVLEWLERSGRDYDTCVLLQPTSPLRTEEDIRRALMAYNDGGGRTLISVSELGLPLGWCGTVSETGMLVDFGALAGDGREPRAAYRLNGAIYIFDCRRFRRLGSYLTPEIRAYAMAGDRAVDVDTLSDLLECQAIISRD